MKKQKFVEHLLARVDGKPSSRGEAFAPANIALCKYWGKRNPDLNLPVHSSLSISLGELGTRTVVQYTDAADRIFLNGQVAPVEFSSRLSAYLDLFRAEGQFFDVQTHNSIPTAAGLASSASGFAALVKALDQLMGWGFNSRELSMLARIGSGSATRSLYDGFAVWHAGVRADGMDSYAEEIPTVWNGFHVGILHLCLDQKKVGSTAGMNRTRETSDLYPAWVKQAACNFDELRTAIAVEDFSMLGKIAENNALAMHATMLAAWPPLCYWMPQTLTAMQTVWTAREEGLELYFTIDAGPNLKLLFLDENTETVKEIFPCIQIVSPFDSLR